MGGRIKTYQDSIFSNSIRILNAIIGNIPHGNERNKYRIAVLTKCSSQLGGFSYSQYNKILGHNFNPNVSDTHISRLTESIRCIDLPFCISLSVLSTQDLPRQNQREAGAFYTDFRLAQALASSFECLFEYSQFPKVIDFSCGSGILLAALSIKFSERLKMNDVLSRCIHGIDISESAKNSTLLALSSMTNSIATIRKLESHLLVDDSLLNGRAIMKKYAPSGFDGVIGNPPWEKLKSSLHEYQVANGSNIHYGDTKSGSKITRKHEMQKIKLKDYSLAVRHWVPEQKGETDLYMPFLGMALDLCRQGGRIAQIIPSSLIRNKNSEGLRKVIFRNSQQIRFTLFDNKPKYFDIDTRFKFLFLEATKSALGAIDFDFAKGKFSGLEFTPDQEIRIRFSDLSRIRTDLSIPEVSNQREWDLFLKLSLKFRPFGAKESLWEHTYCRELDMSLDKQYFKPYSRSQKNLPVIEGRMIHQFQTGIKKYVSGTGRKAIWEPSTSTDLKSQFVFPIKLLSKRSIERIKKARAGFCDITGQTNERTMLASIIPPDCVCGNKVPTLEFRHSHEKSLIPYLWVGICNSFVFDWLLRRTISTNANFFILDNIPIPEPDFNNPAVLQIAQLSKSLFGKASIPQFDWDFAIKRAKIDALVALLYEISIPDMELILKDFKSLDRKLPVSAERKITVTKDIALISYMDILNSGNSDRAQMLRKRLLQETGAYAIPYVPSQFVKLVDPKTRKKIWLIKHLSSPQASR